MDKLGQDTSIAVLSYLDLPSVYHLSLASKLLHRFWDNAVFWHLLLTRHIVPDLRLIIDPAFSIKKLSHPNLWTNLRVADPRAFCKSIVQAFHKVRNLPLNAVEESSHDRDQDLTRTISLNPATFWSSKGSNSGLSNDFLKYELNAPAFVFSVGVRLFRATFLQGRLFPPMQFQVKIGLELEQWDYVSNPVDALQTESVQVLLVLPGLVLGRFLQLELIGKQQIEPWDNLFYVVIESVTCSGIPLSHVDDLQNLSLSTAVPVGQTVQQVSAENYAEWSKTYADNQDLVLRECLEEINETGKLWDYFTDVQKVRPFNKYESYYYLEQLPATADLKDVPFSSFTLSEDIGDLLFSSGQFDFALRVFTTISIPAKMMKCFLKLKMFQKSVSFLQSGRIGNLSLAEVMTIASSLGDDIYSQFEVYLQSHS